MTTMPKRQRDLALGAVWLVAVAAAGVALARWAPDRGLDLAVLMLVAVALVACAWTLHLTWDLRKSVTDMQEQGHYRWALEGLLSPSQALMPPLGGGAVDARRGYHIVNEARTIKAGTVVELGPGASTALLSLWAARQEHGVRIIGIEHEPRWADRITDIMGDLGGDHFELVEASLKHVETGGWQGEWFDIDTVRAALPPAIDLLVVDGPPNHLGGDNRFPAYPLLKDRLRTGSRIYVDDTRRPSERRMVDRWLATGELRLIQDGGDFCVLEVV